MYHKVDLIPPGAVHRGNYVLPAEFEKQLTALKSWGYESVTLNEWLAFRERKTALPKKPLLITFDDGYRTTLTNAWPLLRRAGFSATVFLVSELIGKTNSWDVDEIQEPLLDERDIREMKRGGCSFGSHTRTHVALTKTPLDIATQELSQSREALESLLGEPVTALCYPYAKQNSVVRELARAAGYESALIGRGGVNRVSRDPYALRRIKIDAATTIAGLRRTLMRARLGL
jgi:peptidoglycan/xylan/chitin deacetylase (PgdA/CDA1 family)